MRWPFEIPRLCEIPTKWGDSAEFKARITKCFGDESAEAYYVAMVQLHRNKDLAMRPAVTTAVQLILTQLAAIGC